MGYRFISPTDDEPGDVGYGAAAMSTSTAAPAGIDAPAVTAWYLDHVPGAVAPLGFERVAGGHSCLTYIVTDAAGATTVLRRPPIGHVLATAHDVAREHRIMHALRDTGVPVPLMIGVCTDATVNEAPFYVMQHVAGPVLHTVEDAEALRRRRRAPAGRRDARRRARRAARRRPRRRRARRPVRSAPATSSAS